MGSRRRGVRRAHPSSTARTIARAFAPASVSRPLAGLCFLRHFAWSSFVQHVAVLRAKVPLVWTAQSSISPRALTKRRQCSRTNSKSRIPQPAFPSTPRRDASLFSPHLYKDVVPRNGQRKNRKMRPPPRQAHRVQKSGEPPHRRADHDEQGPRA